MKSNVENDLPSCPTDSNEIDQVLGNEFRIGIRILAYRISVIIETVEPPKLLSISEDQKLLIFYVGCATNRSRYRRFMLNGHLCTRATILYNIITKYKLIHNAFFRLMDNPSSDILAAKQL